MIEESLLNDADAQADEVPAAMLNDVADAVVPPVTTALLEQTFCRQCCDRCTQIDAGNRAARAFALISIYPDHDRRPIETILQPARDNPDHTRMPSLGRGPDKCALGIAFLDLLDCCIQYRCLHPPSLGVQLVQSFRHSCGFVCFGCHKQAGAEISGSDPTTGIDPRPQSKAKVDRRWRSG